MSPGSSKHHRSWKQMAPGQRGTATFQYFNSVRHLSAYTVLTGRQADTKTPPGHSLSLFTAAHALKWTAAIFGGRHAGPGPALQLLRTAAPNSLRPTTCRAARAGDRAAPVKHTRLIKATLSRRRCDVAGACRCCALPQPLQRDRHLRYEALIT